MDAGFGCGSAAAIYNSDFVVQKLDGVNPLVEGAEGFAESGVEGVDWAIAFGDGVFVFAVDGEFDGSFAGGIGAAAPEEAVIFAELEEVDVLACGAADEEFEGAICGFEFEAFIFELFDFF